MSKRILTSALILATLALATAQAQELGIGDPAPALAVKFVKGEAVEALKKDQAYVVEFWATWCGPCRTSIPHLTQLQKKYPKITFIGVSVWEQDQDAVKPFVAEMGDKMDYCVAVDLIPEGRDGNSGAMAKTWMVAAGQNGIPSAFIVNGEGKIAWIGHPMQMDKPLAAVADGTWDLAAAKAQNAKERAQAGKLNELRTKLNQAQQSGDPKKVQAVIDQAITDDPDLETVLGFFKFRLLVGDPTQVQQAQAYGKHLVESVYKENAQALNQLAWFIVDPEAAQNSQLVGVALMAAKKADELSESKDGSIADTLAKAYFDSGDAAKALEAQERAIGLTVGADPEELAKMKERLEQYRKAAQM